MAKSVPRGGCGGYPKIGEKVVNESMGEIKEEIDDAKIIFLCAGSGGCTGTDGIMALAENLHAQFTAKRNLEL